MLGLISIQIYWLQNSITLRDAQFRRNVKVALTEVNSILERQEKMHRLQKHEFGKIKFHVDSLRASASKNPIVLNSSSVYTDTSYLNGKGNSFQLNVSKESKRAQIEEVKSDEDVERYLAQEKNVLAQNLQQQYPFDDFETEELADLFFQFQMIDDGSSFLTRYADVDLDSLLHFALAEYGGISASYHFGICDEQNDPVMVPARSEALISNVVEDGYKMRLLPKDYFTAPTYLHIWFPNRDSYLLKTLWPLLTSSTLFLITIILAFSYTIKIILRQKKVSEIKNDFINNMTHELKTPIATISLACEALNDPVMSSSKKNVSQYVGMIREENKRLGVLVENVLRSAVLDRGEMELAQDEIEIHSLIQKSIRNIEIQVLQKGGQIRQTLKAPNTFVTGDTIHLTNVIYNLLDNAIKYSREQPDILVKTESDAVSIKIMVTDSGIGIKKDDQKRIFDKLFRVPTGNVHNIKGFGLGLSYVKVIVEKHHGTVSVASEPGKGSTFTIQLPFNYDL